VFLTGITDDGAFEDAIEAGADEVIAKPIRRSSLLLRVRSLLRVGQLIGAQESFQAELSSISETLVSLVSPLDRIRARSATLGSHSELPEALRGDVLDLQAAESELVELTKHLRKVIDGMAVVAPAPDGV
jgi:DNA-binding response OmpR family regulator